MSGFYFHIFDYHSGKITFYGEKLGHRDVFIQLYQRNTVQNTTEGHDALYVLCKNVVVFIFVKKDPYLCLLIWNDKRVPTWNLVTHCELQKLRMFPSGSVAWYCGNEFLLQKWHVGSVSAHTGIKDYKSHENAFITQAWLFSFGQKLTITFVIMFSLVCNNLKLRIVVFSLT